MLSQRERERVSERLNDDDDARGGTAASVAGEVGPLNQYGGGVSRRVPARRRVVGRARVPYNVYSAAVRAGRHPCGGAGVGVRAAVEQLLAGKHCTIRPEISGKRSRRRDNGDGGETARASSYTYTHRTVSSSSLLLRSRNARVVVGVSSRYYYNNIIYIRFGCSLPDTRLDRKRIFRNFFFLFNFIGSFFGYF